MDAKEGVRFRAVAFALFALLVGNAVTRFADIVLDRLLGANMPLASAAAGLTVAALLFWWIADYGMRNADRLIGSSARMTPLGAGKPRRFLVMGYSPMDNPKDRADVAAEMKEYGVAHVALPTAEYGKACVERGVWAGRDKPPLNRWQQNIRAIHVHASAAEAVYVLAPDDNEEEREAFMDYVRNAWSDKGDRFVRLITYPGSDEPFYVLAGLDKARKSYEDYTYVYEGIARAMEMIHEAAGAPEGSLTREICVDATSGLKTFSIAAAIATLNADCVFSYVNNDGKARFYDASVQLGRAP